MKESKVQDVYLPVSVEDELPPVEEDVVTISSKFGRDGVNGTEYVGWIDDKGKWNAYSEGGVINDYDNNPDYWRITHWLKKVKAIIIDFIRF